MLAQRLVSSVAHVGIGRTSKNRELFGYCGISPFTWDILKCWAVGNWIVRSAVGKSGWFWVFESLGRIRQGRLGLEQGERRGGGD